MYRFKTFSRPLLAIAVTFGLFAAAVQALDYCAPAPCQASPVCTVAPGNPSLSALARTGLPGFYSNDYDYSMSARYPIGMDYYIPTAQGVIEDSVIPLRNPVDRYYATHKVMNGQVVDESQYYQTALAVPHYVNPDGTEGALATDSETYGPNERPMGHASLEFAPDIAAAR